LNTADKAWLDQQLLNAHEDRSRRTTKRKGDYIDVLPEFKELVQSSAQISLTPGKMPFMLKRGTKRKRTDEQIKQNQMEEELLNTEKHLLIEDIQNLRTSLELTQPNAEKVVKYEELFNSLVKKGMIDNNGNIINLRPEARIPQERSSIS